MAGAGAGAFVGARGAGARQKGQGLLVEGGVYVTLVGPQVATLRCGKVDSERAGTPI